jgi:endoglucanase
VRSALFQPQGRALGVTVRPVSAKSEPCWNEPSNALDATTWNALAARVIAQIRTTNPTRDIFVDGPDFAATRSLAGLVLPDDPHVIASVHAYEPSLFTFQGQTWMQPEWGTTRVLYPGPPPTPIVPVAAAQNVMWVAAWFQEYNTLPTDTNPSGPATVLQQYAEMSSYAASTGRRVYNGEWAAEDGGDIDSRIRWIRAMRVEAESRGIGWCVWDNASTGMKLLDPITGKWDETLLGALFD